MILYKCTYRDCKLNHVKQDHLAIVNQERENCDDETTAALEYLRRHDSSSKWILEEWTTINTKLLLISIAFSEEVVSSGYPAWVFRWSVNLYVQQDRRLQSATTSRQTRKCVTQTAFAMSVWHLKFALSAQQFPPARPTVKSR
jgi:hypothetical protein